MAKIILSMDGAVLREIALLKERVTIGRRPHNDIVIDGPAVSGAHAVIVTMGNESYLEDLNSTNGTQVNGQPVRKHFLQDKDVIELAQYRITYAVNPNTGRECTDSRHLENPKKLQKRNLPAIRILNGTNAGKETSLTKVLTTIGRPGVQVALIAQRRDGFYVSHVEGRHYPLVNGSLIMEQGHRLNEGDVIDLFGTRMEFVLE